MLQSLHLNGKKERPGIVRAFFCSGFEAGRSLVACIGFARQSNLRAESN